MLTMAAGQRTCGGKRRATRARRACMAQERASRGRAGRGARPGGARGSEQEAALAGQKHPARERSAGRRSAPAGGPAGRRALRGLRRNVCGSEECPWMLCPSNGRVARPDAGRAATPAPAIPAPCCGGPPHARQLASPRPAPPPRLSRGAVHRGDDGEGTSPSIACICSRSPSSRRTKHSLTPSQPDPIAAWCHRGLVPPRRKPPSSVEGGGFSRGWRAAGWRVLRFCWRQAAYAVVSAASRSSPCAS